MHLQTHHSKILQRTILITVLGLIVSLVSQTHAGVIHQYQLNGSFLDDLGGPALAPAGGTLGLTNYAFGANQGLSLSNGLTNVANYSIEMVFHFGSLSGYRKILSFKDLTSDSGLYSLGTALNFFPVTTGSSNVFTSGVDVRLVVTRNDTSDQFFGYINGIQQIAFIDSADRAVFTAANNLIQFFKDDFVTDQREASAGVVDLIRIYDTPLSASDITRLVNPVSVVPEPSTLLLLASAAGLLGCGWLRQKRSVNSWEEKRLSL